MSHYAPSIVALAPHLHHREVSVEAWTQGPKLEGIVFYSHEDDPDTTEGPRFSAWTYGEIYEALTEAGYDSPDGWQMDSQLPEGLDVIHFQR